MHRAAFLITVLLLWSGPAQAEPISAAIGLTALITSLGASAAVAGVVGGAIVAGTLSVGLNLLASALSPKSQQEAANATTTQAGIQATLRVGAVTPRNIIVGKQATAGTLVYWNLFGDTNQILQLVFALAAGPHDLFGVIVDGKRATFGPLENGNTYPLVEFSNENGYYARVKFFNGFYDQAVDPDLVDNAQPAGRWPSTNRGRGICYVTVSLNYVPELFPNGIPQFQFEIGARLYDVRLDDTAGGSGSQRWNDQATWAWTDNVAPALYLFERGLFTNGVKQLGRGLAPVDLVTDLFVAAGNVCDEAVDLKAGGTEARYRIGMNIGADRDFAQVEQDFCTAMAGWIMESAGAYGPIAGTSRAVAFTFTTKDMIVGKPMSFAQKRSRSDLVNAVYGVFSDPAQNYQPVPYPARRSSADATSDGQEFAAKHDYPMIISGTQAQRVGEVERQLSRHQVSANVTLGFAFSPAEQGDWCTWTDSPVGELTFQITRYQLDLAQNTTLALREISEAVFDWDPDTLELDPLNPGDLPGIGALITQPAAFSAEAVQLNGPGGLRHPGIRTLWSPISDRTVDRVRVQYRLASQPDDVSDSDPFPPEDGEGIIASGVQAAGEYEVRATIDTTPLRLTTWTDWTPVTAASQHVVPTAQVALSFEAALHERVTAGLRDVKEQMDAIVQWVASQSTEQDAQNFLDKVQSKSRDGTLKTLIDDVTGDLNSIGARVTIAEETIVTGDEAFASLVTDITTNYATSDTASQARTYTQSTATSTAEAAIATYNDTVSSTFGGLTATVSGTFSAVSAINGRLAASYAVTLDVNGYVSGFKLLSNGATSFAAFAVDHFTVGTSGLSSVAVFDIGTVGGVATIILRGSLLADGTISAQHIAAGSINSTKIAINGVDIINIIEGATALRSTVATNALATSGNGSTVATQVVNIQNTTRHVRAYLNLGNVSSSGGSISAGGPGTFYLRCYVDGVLQETQAYTHDSGTGGFVGTWQFTKCIQTYFELAPMAAGNHTFRVLLDASGTTTTLPVGKFTVEELRR
jgi:hypothetical protein